MGNEQSGSRQQREEPKLSQAEVQRMLRAQREMYEKKCQEYIDKASTQNAQSPQSSQNNFMPQSPPMQQAAYAQPAMQHPAGMQQGVSMQQRGYVPLPPSAPSAPQMPQSPHAAGAVSFERQRAPYSYARDELNNIRENMSPNLYPNLHSNQNPANSSSNMHTFSFKQPQNDFVFVNRSGEAQRNRPTAPQNRRDRSVSRPRSRTDDSEWDCPTCGSVFGLQIYQCSSGHSACKQCKDYNRKCRICGQDVTSIRNIDLEKLVADRKVPCLYKNDGCMIFIKMADMEFHVKECPFKEILCPMRCSWRGKLKQLCGHFESSHPEQRVADVDKEMRLTNIKSGRQDVYLILIGNFNFLFHVRVSVDKIYMAVQLIGTKISASKWSYEIHVYNKSDSRRKYLFSDCCSSYIEPITDIFREESCSVLPNAYFSTFVNNDVLTYKVFIKKTIQINRGEFNKNQRGKGKRQN